MIAAIPALLLTAALAPALNLAALPETPAMTETAHALSLDVETRDGVLEVRLVGLSAETQDVRYTLEVKGNWCVRLEAQDADGAPYAVTRGTCPAD